MGIRELWADQSKVKEKRSHDAKFSAAEDVSEKGGLFERQLIIERADGFMARSTQTIKVEGNKIIEVNVVSEEHYDHGQWVKVEAKPAVKPKLPLKIEDRDKVHPKCGNCA